MIEHDHEDDPLRTTALALIAGAADQVAAAAADDGCDMNSTGGSWSRPVFKR